MSEQQLKHGGKICALCKNLQVVESGREFEQIADTEFIVFRCAVFGWTTREDYLMKPAPTQLNASDAEPAFDCPHWEPWPRRGEASGT